MGQATKGSAVKSDKDLAAVTAGAVVEMAELALAFGRIDRTGPQHPDGTPESDSDHTVMLAWIAPSIAHLMNWRAGYRRYNTNKVAAYAAVHDAVEVVVGDTPTIKITEEELAAKAEREKEGSSQLSVQFDDRLPWFGRTLRDYERQQDGESRLVRSVDKMMPKAVHVVCAGQDLLRSGHTLEDFRGVVARQRKQVVEWCNDEFLLELYDALTEMVEQAWKPLPPKPRHALAVPTAGWTKTYIVHYGCAHKAVADCPFSLALDRFVVHASYETLQTLKPGEYPVELGLNDTLVFVGKQEEN